MKYIYMIDSNLGENKKGQNRNKSVLSSKVGVAGWWKADANNCISVSCISSIRTAHRSVLILFETVAKQK